MQAPWNSKSKKPIKQIRQIGPATCQRGASRPAAVICSLGFSTRRTSSESSRDCNPNCFTASFRAADSRIAASSWRWRRPNSWRAVFDLDLWRAAQPGMDEQFDADRFGVWLEVLVESGAAMAAQKLAGMDADLVIAGLAQHARVFDCAVVTPYRTTDGERDAGIPRRHGLAFEVGGYRLVAKRADSWEAIVTILISLDAEHPDYFHQVMRGCRALSNAGHELDELDDLLPGRIRPCSTWRSIVNGVVRTGICNAAQARAFLEMSRTAALGSDAMPPANPIARAYFRRSKR